MGSSEGGGGGAVAVGGDEVRDVALIEALAQAPWTLRAQSRGMRGAGERHGVAKSQVSGLGGVRVAVSSSTDEMPSPLIWAFMLLWCASPFSCRYGDELRSVSVRAA